MSALDTKLWLLNRIVRPPTLTFQPLFAKRCLQYSTNRASIAKLRPFCSKRQPQNSKLQVQNSKLRAFCSNVQALSRKRQPQKSNGQALSDITAPCGYVVPSRTLALGGLWASRCQTYSRLRQRSRRSINPQGLLSVG